jgi:hypothetical protein
MIKFALRLPEDLYAAIKEIAAEEDRSINSQILHILKNFVEQYQRDDNRQEQG